jgi:hypothetical protein
LLAKYGASVVKLVTALYPEHNWEPWKFNRNTKGYWEGAGNQRKFFDWAGKQQGVKELSDWYTVKVTVNK